MYHILYKEHCLCAKCIVYARQSHSHVRSHIRRNTHVRRRERHGAHIRQLPMQTGMELTVQRVYGKKVNCSKTARARDRSLITDICFELEYCITYGRVCVCVCNICNRNIALMSTTLSPTPLQCTVDAVAERHQQHRLHTRTTALARPRSSPTEFI